MPADKPFVVWIFVEDTIWGKGSELPFLLRDRGGIWAVEGKISNVPYKSVKLTSTLIYEFDPVKTSHLFPVVVVIICSCLSFFSRRFCRGGGGTVLRLQEVW